MVKVVRSHLLTRQVVLATTVFMLALLAFYINLKQELLTLCHAGSRVSLRRYTPVQYLRSVLDLQEGATVRFVEYVSSAWEEEWRRNMSTYQEAPCKHLVSVKGADFSESLLTFVKRIKEGTNELNTSDHSHTQPHEVVSHFVYLLGSTQVKVAIEPLVGYYRHPYALCAPAGRSKVSLLDLSYIIFRGMPMELFRIMYPGRKYLFDLGINGPDRSLAWFERSYHASGIDFDEIWAWDLRQFDPTRFWDNVPKSIYSKIHLINVRVGDDITHVGHPFQIIKSIFKKGDYVALKLDIDSPGFEQELADHVLEDEELHDKIADFYYEKHFGAPGFPHHGLPAHGSQDMSSVMEFFTALRKRGIRAHYWV